MYSNPKINKLFLDFLADPDAWEFFLTGGAGTGKTTQLKNLLKLLQKQGLKYLFCAHTHQACKIIRRTLGSDIAVQTLDSLLKFRPVINEDATQKEHIDSRTQACTPEADLQVLLIDEYSMIGEAQAAAIKNFQDPEYTGKPKVKVVYIGDLHQLGPIKDKQVIFPHNPYWVNLTTRHRTDKPDLVEAMIQLERYIDDPTQPLQPLKSGPNFRRGVNLLQEYQACKSGNKIFLAWTNEAVQYWNEQLHGSKPRKAMFCRTLKHEMEYLDNVELEQVTEVYTPTGPLELGTKYQTLEYLKTMPDIEFMRVYDITVDSEYTIAAVFGTYNYKVITERYSKIAADVNASIEEQYNMSAKNWAQANKIAPLARKRAKAWRDLLTFKNAVLCVDHNYAMTIHTSQGSTFEWVFLDTQDLKKCAKKNLKQYLQLYYVAISRATKGVFTS